MGKKKKHVNDFSTLSNRWYEYKERNKTCFVGIKILNNNRNTTIITQRGWRSATFLKRDSNTVFIYEISAIFKNTFSSGTPVVAASDIW